jgi:carboxyl-terminal processing protease
LSAASRALGLASIALAGALALPHAAVAVARSPEPAPSPGIAIASLDPLDFLELQIVYTTVLARYYEKVAPSTLVGGARVGLSAALVSAGIRNVQLPYPDAHISVGDGEDLVDSMVLRALARYAKRVDGHRLVSVTIQGELGALDDPYTVLFRPQAFKKFNAFLGNSTFGGIGAVVSFDDALQHVSIDRVIPGSPAARAGLLRGDALVEIDGRPVAELGAAGVRDALRGAIGKPVDIIFSRAVGPPPPGEPAGGTDYKLTIVRAAVHDPETTRARFGDIGYVALSRFGDRSGDEVRAALRDFTAAGVRGVVFDLRANGGGYGDEATAVASAFVPAGPIFTTIERGGARVVASASGSPVWTGPLVVLVDGNTASAAEIVAGAIADAKLGTLVGTRTFGKGVVQSIFPLPDDSAMKLTTARYTTRAGHDIAGRGIEPAVVVVEPPGAQLGDPASDPQLARALEILGTSDGSPSPAPSPLASAAGVL